jgi:mycothiol synthase
MINIREFDKEKDYPALITLMNALYVGSNHTEEEMRGGDEDNPNQVAWGRFLAERNGEVVGNAVYWQNDHNPQEFWLNLHYADNTPEVGEGLYQALLAAIAPHHPIDLGTRAHEDMVTRTAFLQKQGFVETMRDWHVRLDVANFAPDILQTFQSVADKVSALGINIYSYAELAGDPEREQKLYALNCIVEEAARWSSYTAPSLESFKKDFLEDTLHFLHNEWFIAVEGDSKNGKYIGMTILKKPNEGDYRNVHGTGVLPEYHRQGIASALKLRATLYARENNIPEIRTGGASKVMLAINEKMGFVKQPAWLTLKKEII